MSVINPSIARRFNPHNISVTCRARFFSLSNFTQRKLVLRIKEQHWSQYEKRTKPMTVPGCSLFGLMVLWYRWRGCINNSALVGNYIRWYFRVSHKISNTLLVSYPSIHVQHTCRNIWSCNKILLGIQALICISYRRLSARLHYLQFVGNGDTAVVH